MRNYHHRKARGSRQGMSKLTEADVLKMRRAYAADDGTTMDQLAETYGVTNTTSGDIIHERTWLHCLEASDPEQCEDSSS